MPITIYSRRAGNFSVEVVSIIGRFTVGEDQHDFRLRTREILARNVHLLLDLAELSFADSAALGEILAAHTAAASAGRQLKLLNPQRQFQVLLRVTRLTTLLESFDSESDALATYSE